MDKVIELKIGSLITPLKKIKNPKGDIFHGLKLGEQGFNGFGEAYFSHIHKDLTKGWKLHRKMTSNLIVPVGSIQFYLRSEDGTISESIILGEENYARLTVPPLTWLAFCGVGKDINLLLNIASIPHDPGESINKPLNEFPLGHI